MKGGVDYLFSFRSSTLCGPACIFIYMLMATLLIDKKAKKKRERDLPIKKITLQKKMIKKDYSNKKKGGAQQHPKKSRQEPHRYFFFFLLIIPLYI